MTSILHMGAPRPDTKVCVEVHSAYTRAEHNLARWILAHLSVRLILEVMVSSLSAAAGLLCPMRNPAG